MMDKIQLCHNSTEINGEVSIHPHQADFGNTFVPSESSFDRYRKYVSQGSSRCVHKNGQSITIITQHLPKGGIV